jgi:Cys-rich repeat protein
MHPATVAGILVSLFPLAFISYINFGGIRKALRDRRARSAEAACSIDSDCPDGFVCQNGRCIPATR